MDTLIQLAHLTEEDLLSLSEKVAENLAIAFDSVVHESVDAKEQLAKCKETNEIEVKLIKDECAALKSDLELTTANLSNVRETLSNEERKTQKLTLERDELNKKLVDCLAVSGELEMVIKDLENDKESLSALLTKKISEYECISADLLTLQEEAKSARRIKSDALTQLEEINTEKALLALREKRLEETTESIKKHNTWLEEELHKSNDKLLSIRRDNSEKYLNLESELASRKAELENAQSSIAKLESLVKRLTESNEDHIEKLKIRTEELAKMDQLHANELEAQRRLTDLYKEQVTEAERKCEQMERAVTEMQKLLNEGHEHVIQLQSDKVAFVDTLMSEKNELIAQNSALTKELQAAVEIVDKFRIQGLSEEELRQLNPAVATTIASLKRGRSLTQIYSDYVQVVEERDLLKLDKERLTEHLREIMTQLEENGPLLRSQQEAYHKGKSRISELESQLETALIKVKEEREALEDQRRRSGYFNRQNMRLKQSCKDLSTQVQHLLHELETARGTVITPTAVETLETFPDSTDDADCRKLLQLCSSEVSTAASVIDKNLVTFNNLVDLQTQNARLLLVARDLASQLEDRESTEDKLANQVSEITTKVDALSGEVQVARLAASEARSEADLAKRQCGAFKDLLQKHAIPLPDSAIPDASTSYEQDISGCASLRNASMFVHPDTSGIIDVSVMSNSSRANITSTGEAQSLMKLEESICSIHAEYKQYREDKAKSDEVFSTTIENLRRDEHEAKILNQKLAAQLDFTHEKFRTLEGNVANYKQEISILREMNARYTTSAAASDEALTALREQTSRTSDRLAAVEVECRQLARQLEHARANETRLIQELESTRKMTVMHEQLMHQLQSIQGNLEHREETERRQANRRVASLEEELTILKKSSEEKINQMTNLNMTLQSELLHATQALRCAEEEANQLRTSMAAPIGVGFKNCSPIELDIESSEHPQLHAFSNQTSTLSTVTTGPENQPSAAQLRQLERECESLSVSLEAVRKQSAEYQQLGMEMEAHIASLTREREQMHRDYATELDDSNQRCELLRLQLILEKNERQDLLQSNMRITDEHQVVLAKLRTELSTAQAMLKEAEDRRDAALKVEVSSRSEVAAHQRTAKEAREKYETELRLHSQDVQLLMEARNVAEAARSEVEGLRDALATAKIIASQTEEQSQAQCKLWDEERDRFIKRIEDADAEVHRLQEQILKLSEQIVNLRKLLERSNDDALSSDELHSQIKASEDFTHLLEYLRRQKSIAEAAEEAATAEVSRLHVRTKSLESQLAELHAKLDEERKTSEIRAETSSRYATVMSQIEQVNVLSESNRLLRQERETVRNAANQAEEQLASLRAEIQPLRSRYKELEDINDVLLSEKRSLIEERDRWKERCTRLVETSKRMDPEEYKQACNARDELQAHLEATEEAKACLERETESRILALEQQICELSSNLTLIKAEEHTHTTKISALEEQCNKQQEELSKKQLNIMKLREIGRKYRQETDELRRQLSSTQQNEETVKTTGEALIAVRADLMNTQASLQVEQEQSTLLRQEIAHLNQLLRHIELLPEITSLGPDSPDSLIGEIPTQAPFSLNTYNRLNSLLSSLMAEIVRLRSQAEVQSERILRMQLIESQLTKTQRQCTDLKAQLAASMSSSSEPILAQPVAIPSVIISSPLPCVTETSDTPLSAAALPPATTVVTPANLSGSSSWVMRAAVAVQPVQTPPLLVQSESPSSNAPRQMVEIRPLPNYSPPILSTEEPQPPSGVHCISAVAPSRSTHPNSDCPTFGHTQISNAGSLGTLLLPQTRFAVTQQDISSSSFSNDEQANTGISIQPCVSSAAKRTYEEAVLSSEQNLPQMKTAASLTEVEISTPVFSDSQELKRLKTTAVAPARSYTSTTQLVSPLPIAPPIVITDVVEREADTDVYAEMDDGETEEEDMPEEVEDASYVEESGQQMTPPMDYLEGDTEVYTGNEEESAVEVDLVNDASLVIETNSSPYLPEPDVNPETETQKEPMQEDDDEEDESSNTDFETEDQNIEVVEGDEVDEDDVIILSSDQEEDENDDSADDNEDDEEEGQTGDEVEEEDNEVDLDAVPNEDVSTPTTTVSTSDSLFSHTPALSSTSSSLFGTPNIPASGGLFASLKARTLDGDRPGSLFGNLVTKSNDAASPSTKGLFSSVLTPSESQTGGSLSRSFTPSTLANVTLKPTSLNTVAPSSGPTSDADKQKIRPIVWTDSPSGARKPPSTSNAPAPSTSGLFGPAVGVSGRRKNWGSFGGVSKGVPRPGHR